MQRCSMFCAYTWGIGGGTVIHSIRCNSKRNTVLVWSTTSARVLSVSGSGSSFSPASATVFPLLNFLILTLDLDEHWIGYGVVCTVYVMSSLAMFFIAYIRIFAIKCERVQLCRQCVIGTKLFSTHTQRICRWHSQQMFAVSKVPVAGNSFRATTFYSLLATVDSVFNGCGPRHGHCWVIFPK